MVFINRFGTSRGIKQMISMAILQPTDTWTKWPRFANDIMMTHFTVAFVRHAPICQGRKQRKHQKSESLYATHPTNVLVRSWRVSRPQHCSRADIAPRRPQKWRYNQCINLKLQFIYISPCFTYSCMNHRDYPWCCADYPRCHASPSNRGHLKDRSLSFLSLGWRPSQMTVPASSERWRTRFSGNVTQLELMFLRTSHSNKVIGLQSTLSVRLNGSRNPNRYMRRTWGAGDTEVSVCKLYLTNQTLFFNVKTFLLWNSRQWFTVVLYH